MTYSACVSSAYTCIFYLNNGWTKFMFKKSALHGIQRWGFLLHYIAFFFLTKYMRQNPFQMHSHFCPTCSTCVALSSCGTVTKITSMKMDWDTLTSYVKQNFMMDNVNQDEHLFYLVCSCIVQYCFFWWNRNCNLPTIVFELFNCVYSWGKIIYFLIKCLYVM